MTLPTDIKTALIIADVHGNLSFLKSAIRFAKQIHADAIIQCGDFGFFPRFPGSYDIVNQKFEPNTKYVPKGCMKIALGSPSTVIDYDFPVYFIDGNHEDFIALSKYQNGINKIRENLWYINRGTSIRIGDCQCLFIGGAHSIDKKQRLEDVTWYEQENITEKDLSVSLNQKKSDIVFSHDCPTVVDIVHDRFNESIANRDKLQEILVHHDPLYWFFGHYHRYHTFNDPRFNTDFYALPADFDQDRKGVLFDFTKCEISDIIKIS